MVAEASHFRVAVVGGGITGLSAAQRLITSGLDPAELVLVEGSSLVGGKVLTEEIDGFLVEAGPDSFVPAKATVVELASELGIGDQIIQSRTEHRGSYVWWEDRLHLLPEGMLLMAPARLRPVFRSSLLSRRGRLRVLGDLVLPRRASGGDESLEDFVVRRLGREVLERIAEPLVAGIHAAEPATMSLRASFPRLLDMERAHRSLIIAARRARSGMAAGETSTHFASFRRGMGELTSALSTAISGVDLRTGLPVVGLARLPGGYRLELAGGSHLSSEQVILAVPSGPASRLLAAAASDAAGAVASIRQVSTAAVTFGYQTDRLPLLAGYGFLVPSAAKRLIMGVSYLSNKWAGRVPDPGFFLLRAFVARRQHQELTPGSEGRLVEVVRGELSEMLGIVAQPGLTRVHVWEGGLHQYTLGHLDRVARAEAALPAGLHLAGSAFHGIGLNECVSSGRRAAEAAQR